MIFINYLRIINLVKTKLPYVKTIQLPKDPTSYADIIDGLGVFDSLSYSSEDKQRTKMYQEEVKRKNFKENFTNLDDYLSTLAMELEIKKNDPFSSPRIAQLCQRTNQFNLTSKRYTEAEIKSYTIMIRFHYQTHIHPHQNHIQSLYLQCCHHDPLIL